ncbi:MAG: AmmeMemoRadiSam system protein B [Bacteroidales bacterium]|nr:AmmeMemoRadiSam system protein B [Bacteroidales bacterium]
MTSFGPGPKMRRMAVAGQFYPESKSEMESVLGEYFGKYKNESGTKGQIAAVIVPHAGYVFSGYTAAAAYSKIPEDASYDRIFILGPSHHAAFEGASVNYAYDAYMTPLGPVPTDTAICRALTSSSSCFGYYEAAHSKEHCIEVQLPFLQYRLRKMPPIVPIIIGTENYKTIHEIAEGLEPYFNERNLFVISSDFSHYPSYDDACTADDRTAQAILTGDPVRFAEALKYNKDAGIHNLFTSACGQTAIMTLMLLSKWKGGCSYHHEKYMNSGDSEYGDKKEVVGYNAFIVTRSTEKAGNHDGKKFDLTRDEKKTLLHIARKSIQTAFDEEKLQKAWEGENLTGTLESECGAFVTLNEDGHLRGCIGHFGENIPLYKTVAMMARAAAFEDTRFREVTREELTRIDIEISVLSPLEKIAGADEFEYGKQGIYMVRNGRSGTFLPQVAQESNWTKEEFLGHCARDKAGIGWDGWKTADLYTYYAIVFSENE